MKIQQAVKDETKRLALGVMILTALMLGIYLILGIMTFEVVLGAVLGTAVAVGNFFLMALSVQKAAEHMNGVRLESYEEKDAQDAEKDEDEKAQDDDPAAITPEIRQAKRQMQASYFGRMLLMGVCAVIGVVAPCFDSLAVLLPLLFPQFVVMILNFVQTHRKGA